MNNTIPPATVLQNYLPVKAVQVLFGVTTVIVDCPNDYETYSALPAAIEYNGVICGKTGFNSDNKEAYYKSFGQVALVVQQDKDSYQPALDRLLAEYEHTAGTDASGAIRDLLTELVHACEALGLDPEERFHAAQEVAEEHNS